MATRDRLPSPRASSTAVAIGLFHGRLRIGKARSLLRLGTAFALGLLRRHRIIAMTPEEQLSFWKALNESPKLTPAQRRLGATMRGQS